MTTMKRTLERMTAARRITLRAKISRVQEIGGQTRRERQTRVQREDNRQEF